jgi:hypothetical protein
VSPKGTITHYTDLPTFPAPVDGDQWVVADDGKLYIYDGGWPEEGDGIPFVGPQGQVGPTGPKGDTGDTGARGVTWKGDWSESTTYTANDTVKYEGNVYIALLTHAASATTPDADSTNWDLFTEKGDTGDQGASGSGTGDVIGPGSSADGEVVLYNGSSGTSIKRATGSGLAKLTSGKLGTATSGTDYAPPTSGTSLLKGNGSGGFSAAAVGTDYLGPTTGSVLQKADGSGGLEPATAGEDYLAPDSTANVTNLRVSPRIGSVTTAAIPAINTDNYDQFNITALADVITDFSTGLSGTPADGQRLLLRIKDAGTAKAITWGSKWRAIGVGMPTTTIVGKTMYVGAIYNLADTKWDVVAVGQEA